MRKRRWLALGLSLVMACSMNLPVGNHAYAAETVTIGENVMTELPGTIRVEKDYDETFLSVTGFGAEGVQDRSCYYEEYVENGYQDTDNYMVVDEDYYKDQNGGRITPEAYEALSQEEKAGYTLVMSEEQFCYAMSKARVVEIRVDLELGYKWLEEHSVNTYGVVNKVTDYDKGNEPITSPVLMERGVSDISTKSHMTIFSPNGATLSHAGFDNNNVYDVVIRNLSIQGMYEWDDMPEGQQNSNTGNNKRYGWCNITNKDAHGIWIDHCTLGVAFDGNIDNKNSAQVSITWCEIGVQDISVGSDLWICIQYMEELYQKGEGFHIYTKERDSGRTPEDILMKCAQHKKVSIVSAGPDDYDWDPEDAVTMAYTKYVNVGSRVPSGMMCNSHMFNVWIDNEDWVGMRRSMNPHHGASMGADTCVFDGVQGAVLGNEIETEENYAGNAGYNKLIGAVNYQLIVNSKIRLSKGDSWYMGSSWDNNGINKFTQQWTWSGLAGSYLKTKEFKWAEWTPVSKSESAADEGDLIIPDTSTMKNGEYYEKYYIGRENLGYNYQTFPLETVETNLDSYAGMGKINLDNAGEWTKLYYGIAEDEKIVNIHNEGGYVSAQKHYVYSRKIKAGEKIGELPVPELDGYTFIGYYEGKLETVDGKSQITYSDEPVTAETVVTDDMELYARYEVNKYTVSFDSMGGSQVMPYVDVPAGTTFSSMGGLPAPVREGYSFIGWYASYDSSKFSTKILAATKVSRDMTVYAKWQPEKVTVKFNTGGGSEIEPQEVKYNTTIALPEIPTKDNSTFVGWFTDEAYTKAFQETTKINDSLGTCVNNEGTVTLYAKWEDRTRVKISFDLQGGQGSDGSTPEAIEVTPGEIIGNEISDLPIPVKAEHIFAGWYTEEAVTDGEGNTIMEKRAFTTESAIEADTIVYADWQKKGDADSNEEVTAEDALIVLKQVVGLLEDTPLSKTEQTAADVDADGTLTAEDALWILKRVVGAIPGFDDING